MATLLAIEIPHIADDLPPSIRMLLKAVGLSAVQPLLLNAGAGTSFCSSKDIGPG